MRFHVSRLARVPMLRTRVLGLAVVLTACSHSPTGPADGIPCAVVDAARARSVHVEVPEVYELANIILALTSYEQLASHTVLRSAYLDEVIAHFGPHRTHALIARLNSRLTSGGSWSYDAYYGFRENSYAYAFDGARLTRQTSARPWG